MRTYKEIVKYRFEMDKKFTFFFLRETTVMEKWHLFHQWTKKSY